MSGKYPVDSYRGYVAPLGRGESPRTSGDKRHSTQKAARGVEASIWAHNLEFFRKYPYLTYLMFLATEEQILAMGFSPDQVDEWMACVDEDGCCPQEFGRFDVMQAQVGVKVQEWVQEHDIDVMATIQEAVRDRRMR